jgi:hypothetical protein
MNDNENAALRADRDHIQRGFNAAVATVEGLQAENAVLRAVLREYIEAYGFYRDSQYVLETRARALLGEK